MPQMILYVYILLIRYASEHSHVLSLVRRAKATGVRIRILLIDGAYCVGDVLWSLKHTEKVEFIVPADSGKYNGVSIGYIWRARNKNHRECSKTGRGYAKVRQVI